MTRYEAHSKVRIGFVFVHCGEKYIVTGKTTVGGETFWDLLNLRERTKIPAISESWILTRMRVIW